MMRDVRSLGVIEKAKNDSWVEIAEMVSLKGFSRFQCHDPVARVNLIIAVKRSDSDFPEK